MPQLFENYLLLKRDLKIEIPTLQTKKLVLLSPNTNCFDAYKRFYTDADASKMYGGPITIGEAFARLKVDLGSWYLLGFGVWSIQFEGKIVGTCGFWQGKGWPRELTWWLLPEARGKGIAFEASVAAVKYGYDEFRWETVETYMHDDNIAARKLVEKLDGIKIRRDVFPDGVSRDVYRIPNKA